MTEQLTAERILDTAEDVLRRYGPAKATVVDVARALGVSHGSVYRHFGTKAALREAVAERWLHRVSAPMAAVADDPARPAPERLRHWIRTLNATKRHYATQDPELQRTFRELMSTTTEVVAAHEAELAGQLGRIVAAGVAAGDLAAADPAAAGRAVFQATARFHHPAHAADWASPANDTDLDAVVDLLLTGLSPR
ncbi:TetR family transcriptional regulator [Kitasatospora phosalacinea]|uniref:TetR family transcriptional regulator n=1 Tax=Kitasatospora phosalacinea TaxID=2065 RepID=A0A9W6QGY2_9ACTN|nr:TetR/AcrR family transcriptional regulator [Kitasatospora phosalacinea]GLW74829.1 TetR family transcriptional regulator [Kitasatospora phosalacinea]